MIRLRSLALVAALAAAACRHESHAAEEPPRFLVTTPLRKDVTLTQDFVAQVRAIQHIEVRALEKGYLQGVFVDEGQVVPSGTRLFQVMPLVYQAEVKRAEAEAKLSEIELGNTKLLADKNIVSPNELSLVDAKLKKAQADVALASSHRSLTELRAPFAGIVGRFHARKGSLVTEGDLLTTLSDNSTVWVYFNVSEREYLAYRARKTGDGPTPVELVMADGRVFDQPGKLETIEADFHNDTGNLAFRAGFPNPKGLLRHGETGKVRMTSPLPGALVVPQKATFDVLDKKYVYVVDDKNEVHARPITTSAELPNVYVVEKGLAETDRVLVEGLRRVREGSAIGVDFKPPAEVLAHLDVAAE